MCGAKVMLAGKGLCWPIGAQGGTGGEAQAPLSRCCSLFVPVTLAAVAGDREGPGSHADGSLGLVHSSGTVRALGVATRSLDGLQPVIHPPHLILGWAAAPSPGSHPLVPFWLVACAFLTLLTPFLARCFQPLLSPWEEHGRIELTRHRDEADPGMGKGLGAGLLDGNNALSLWKATQATMRVG